MIQLLPHWRITETRSKIYDLESATSIEQTAKLYGKMQELIEDYNKFVDELNTKITEHYESVKDDHEAFESSMRQEFQDFIDTINLRYMNMENEHNKCLEDLEAWKVEQERVINEAKSYLVTNLRKTIDDMIAEGKLNIAINYEEAEEELTLVAIPLDSDNSIVYTSSEEKIDII